MPEGLIRLGIVEGPDLDGKDWNPFGKSTSDPYATIRVGARSHMTSTVDKTLAPQWGDSGWYDFFIFDRRQTVNLEVFDKDMLSTDDIIGRLNQVNLQDVITKKDGWWPIFAGDTMEEGGGLQKAGEIRIVAQEFHFSQSEQTLQKMNIPMKTGLANSAALLTVQLRCLQGLPEKFGGAKIKMIVGAYKQMSAGAHYIDAKKATDSTGEVVEQSSFTANWDQGFNVLVENPENATVQLELIIPGREDTKLEAFDFNEPAESSEHNPPIVPFQLKQLIDRPNMIFDDILCLKHATMENKLDLEIQFQLWGLAPGPSPANVDEWGPRGDV